MSKGKKKTRAAKGKAASIQVPTYLDVVVDVCENADLANAAIVARELQGYELIDEIIAERDFAHSSWNSDGGSGECARGVYSRESVVLVFGYTED